MCNYDIRLNDRFIVKHCTSLRLAILTLALLNGDLSLLVPELYLPYHINEISNKWEACPTDGLLSPFDTNPGAIHDRTMLEKGPLNPRSYAHTLIGTATFGLPLPAYIWTIDRELDLSCLKEQLASYWHELKILRITVVPQEGESDFAFRARQNTAYQHISGKIDIQKKALQEIFQHGHVHKNSEVWSGVDPTGIRCTAELNVALIESDPAARQKLAGIIFVILAHLNRLARRDPGAAGVANSIWHSLRVDYIQGLEVKLPDMVCDDLFTHPGVLLDAFSTIQLHKGPDNSYLQTWFIDRIMRHGTLWIGRYTRVHESMISRRTSAFAFLPFEDQAIGKGSRGRSEVSDERQGSSSSGQPQSVSDRFREKDILDQQSGKETFAELSEIAMFHSFGSSGASKGINVGALVRLLDVRFRSIWTAEADEARAQELLSIFDVDGPCVIATPFNAEWETLPHSALRSMSTCWVVEELNRHAYGRVPVIEPLCVESKGKGKEKETLSNENPLPEKEGEPDENTPLYKVVAKVKGFWQLMGFPYGDVLFI
ncbi:hypothetical protein CGMCC3_g2182 [Colletotrichum fructicola]|nr:uncharacterized protein CGMCC3_g2182 [Colletotrichum fructicola]KAE9582101.1 hypothetical protein CGMCC3_g2182 [Colletotrichum fructicola]KAF4493136.1 hypothetical protein CGGC5_v001914 [Colletotrichum fructicola Nara gc5]